MGLGFKVQCSAEDQMENDMGTGSTMGKMKDVHRRTRMPICMYWLGDLRVYGRKVADYRISAVQGLCWIMGWSLHFSV